MPKSTPRTIRFSELVKRSGAPEVYAIWTDPKADASLMKAVAQKRLLTVHQENVGNRKDFGVVGFEEGKGLSYLVFPKAINGTEGTKVVGLKYDNLATPKVRDPVRRSRPRNKRSSPKAKAKQPEEVVHMFHATVEFRISAQTTVAVEAANQTEARQKALAAAAFDPASARIGAVTKRIVRLTKKA